MLAPRLAAGRLVFRKRFHGAMDDGMDDGEDGLSSSSSQAMLGCCMSLPATGNFDLSANTYSAKSWLTRTS